MITETNKATDMNAVVKNPLGLKKIHHVEFYVGNAKQAEFYYRKAFGFSRIGYMGLETGNREVTSYLLKQNNVNFILSTPLSPDHPGSEHIKQHGDGVHDIAFQVEDAPSVDCHLVLSGGLTPANVTDGILQVRPRCRTLAVDVSSGVEMSKGIKDADKIHQFVAAVRAADAQLARHIHDHLPAT